MTDIRGLHFLRFRQSGIVLYKKPMPLTIRLRDDRRPIAPTGPAKRR